jgi:hypothetical protein
MPSSTNWRETTALPTTRYQPGVVVHNGCLVVAGGASSLTPSAYGALATVITAKITGSGELGTWTSCTSLPAAQIPADTVALNGFIYLIGAARGALSNRTVQYGRLLPNGQINSWATQQLPFDAVVTKVLVNRNQIFAFGTDGASTQIWKAAVNSDGTFGRWTSAGTLPTANLTPKSVWLVDNKVWLHLDGGTVYVGNMDSTDGVGGWVTVSPPVTLAGAELILTKNRVYLMGGANTTPEIDIAVVAKANLVDGETLTISDGLRTEVFEFDVAGDGVVAGRVQVNVSADVTAEDVEARLITAINGTSLAVTASNGGAGVVAVLRDSVGFLSADDTVADDAFTVTSVTAAGGQMVAYSMELDSRGQPRTLTWDNETPLLASRQSPKIVVDDSSKYCWVLGGLVGSPEIDITVVAKASLADTDTLTISDGIVTKVFEFDTAGDGVTSGRVQVNVSTDVTAEDVEARLITAINNTTLDVTAANSGAGKVAVSRDTPGTLVITESVINAGFTVTAANQRSTPLLANNVYVRML